jgi:hypothetical protein
LSDEDIADILREADAGASEKQQPAAAKKTPEKVQSDDDAIEYFKDDGEYQIPVDIKGKKSSWRVPLD